MRPDKTEDLRTTRYLKSTPDLLYRGLTDAKLIAQWFVLFGAPPAGVDMSARPGEELVLTRVIGPEALSIERACVIEAVPSRRLVLSTALGAGFCPSGVANPETLALDLFEIASGTRLEARLLTLQEAATGPLAGWDAGLSTLDAMSARLPA